MIIKQHILKFNRFCISIFYIAVASVCCLFSSTLHGQISVFAGSDQTICSNDTLYIADLGSTISGSVTNGYWFTSGDGYFLPIQPNNRFSITTKYVPGSNDRLAGFVNLILVSDDPDGIGPLVQVTDQVKISFLGNLTLVCNSYLNISLGNDCTQQVTPAMLVANMQQPFGYYNLKVRDQYNQPIANNILTSAHIGKNLEYSIGHDCGTNTCWGYINVQDKLPPELICKNKTILCGINTMPDSIGFPIPSTAKAKKIGTKKYRVTGLDACGPATLTYVDAYIAYECDSVLLQGKLTRTWTAVDSFGNSSICTEIISIKNRTLSQVPLPFNYDDSDKPAFRCHDLWPKLPSGYPSPDTTGVAKTEGCTHLESTYTDAPFQQCGASYKILRKWTIINWCGTLIMEHNQLIKVVDDQAPTFDCPSDLTLYTSAYECNTGLDTLPYPINVKDCSTTSLKINVIEWNTNIDFTYLTGQGSNGKIIINHLPIGIYQAYYIMTDACGNADTCAAFLTVKDNKVPVAVCDQVTKVSLSTAGSGRMYANTIDDGSFDNCSISTFKVAKMSDACNNSALVFGDYVDFCCLEANTSVMTIMRVTDNFGNSNTCMVEVQVQDKIAPIIFCPSNLTISCKNAIDTSNMSQFGTVVKGSANIKPIFINDPYNNGLAGYDGYYTDNCDAVITSTVTDNTSSCHTGTFIRTFKATDKNNNTATCQQLITVRDPLPFALNNIVWPNPTVTINGCDATVATVDKTGQPTFNNFNCATVAATFDDKLFYDIDGVCIKILREWTVLDWCQFNANTGVGKWSKIQTIKINNSIAPQFDQACKDVTFCIYTENCGAERYRYLPSAKDDCTEAQFLNAVWQVDMDNNGTIDTIGSSLLIDVMLRPGNHKITYTVSDKCHNTATCSFIVNAMDCKKPSPYCNSNITSVLMPNSASLLINARSFNLGSFDNCTSQTNLKFSFSDKLGDSTTLITCADIDNGVSDTLSLKMWVTDEAGNKEYCSVSFIIYDNNDVCQDKNLNASASGQIVTMDKVKKIPNVQMQMVSSNIDYSSIKYSDDQGLYNASGFPASLPLTVFPLKNDSLSEGLTTLDIILIQRHILGSARFNDPYRIIAADIDGNKKVSVSDLVALRKIILGSSTTLPKGRDCYTFVPVDYTFADINQPFTYPDSIRFDNLNTSETNEANFIGIKIGDVNYSIGNNATDISNERSQSPSIIVENKNGHDIFYSDIPLTLYGLQLSIPAFDGNVEDVTVMPSLGEYEIAIINQELRIVTYSSKKIEIEANQPIITIKSRHIGDYKDNTFNEWYDADLNPIHYNIIRNIDDDQVRQSIKIHSIYGRPILQSQDRIDNATITTYDIMGRVISRQHMDIMEGNNAINPQLSVGLAIQFITVTIGGKTYSFKNF